MRAEAEWAASRDRERELEAELREREVELEAELAAERAAAAAAAQLAERAMLEDERAAAARARAWEAAADAVPETASPARRETAGSPARSPRGHEVRQLQQSLDAQAAAMRAEIEGERAAARGRESRLEAELAVATEQVAASARLAERALLQTEPGSGWEVLEDDGRDEQESQEDGQGEDGEVGRAGWDKVGGGSVMREAELDLEWQEHCAALGGERSVHLGLPCRCYIASFVLLLAPMSQNAAAVTGVLNIFGLEDAVGGNWPAARLTARRLRVGRSTQRSRWKSAVPGRAATTASTPSPHRGWITGRLQKRPVSGRFLRTNWLLRSRGRPRRRRRRRRRRRQRRSLRLYGWRKMRLRAGSRCAAPAATPMAIAAATPMTIGLLS